MEGIGCVGGGEIEPNRGMADGYCGKRGGKRKERVRVRVRFIDSQLPTPPGSVIRWLAQVEAAVISGLHH